MACYYSEYCFYSPSEKNTIDFLTPENKTQINDETIEEVRQRCPDAIKIKSDDAILFYEQEHNYKSDVTEIDENKYLEMLGVLPPLGHSFTDGCETFKISEMLTGKITSIFCSFGSRYFTFNDSVTLKHHEIHQRIIESEAYKSKH